MLNFTDVVVKDCGVDACLVAPADGGRPFLVLSPHQTFGFAAKAVARVVPEATDSEIRALLRKHLPNTIDVDELIERHATAETRAGSWAVHIAWVAGVAVLVFAALGVALVFSSGHSPILLSTLSQAVGVDVKEPPGPGGTGPGGSSLCVPVNGS